LRSINRFLLSVSTIFSFIKLRTILKKKNQYILNI
jgi:hypothetical protein